MNRDFQGASSVGKLLDDLKKLNTETDDYSKTVDRLTQARLDNEVSTKKVIAAEERLGRAMESGNYERITRAETNLDNANKNLIRSNRDLINAGEQVGNIQRTQIKTLSDLEKAQQRLNIAAQKYNSLIVQEGPLHPKTIQAQIAASDAAKNLDKITAASGQNKPQVINDTARIRQNYNDIYKAVKDGTMTAKDAKAALSELDSQINKTSDSSNRGNIIVRAYNATWGKLISELDKGRNVFSGLGTEMESFSRGVTQRSNEADNGIKRMSSDMLKLFGGGFGAGYNLDQTIQKFSDGLFSLNTRFEQLAGIITLVGALIVELVGAITALASAAAVAAAAVGGAFMAALAQLVPIVALLYGTFTAISQAIAAATLQQKANTTATQNAVQVQNAHKAALQQVQIAEQNLTKARLDASRNLVDSANKRIDAALAERSATLSLAQAKLNLQHIDQQIAQSQQGIRDRQAAVAQAQRQVAQAKSQGNQGDIVGALQSLGIAEQQLQTYQVGLGPAGADLSLQRQQAVLAVDQARQQQRESVINLRRAIQDNALVQKQGINQNPAVLSAIHSLTTAQNALAASTQKVAGQTSAVQAAFAALTPAERQFAHFWANTFGSNGPIDKIYTGFTDRIIGGIEKALKRIIILFKDPALKKAFGELANSISNSFVQFAKFFTSPDQKKFIEFFTTEAAKNFPLWITLIERLITLFERIAKAASPALTEMIKGFTGDITAFTNNISAGTQGGTSATRTFSASAQDAANRSNLRPQTGSLTDFFTHAEDYAKALGQVFGAFGRLIGAIITAAAPSGMNAFQSLITTFNNWTTWVNNNKGAIGTFTQQSINTIGDLLVAVGKLLGVIVSVATKNPAVLQNLIKFLAALAVPALSVTAATLTPLFAALAKLFSTPGLGTVLGNLIGFLLAMKVVLGLVGSIPVLGGLLKKLFSNVLTSIITKTIEAGVLIVKNFPGGGGTPGKPGGGNEPAPTPGGPSIISRLKNIATGLGGLLTLSAPIDILTALQGHEVAPFTSSTGQQITVDPKTGQFYVGYPGKPRAPIDISAVPPAAIKYFESKGVIKSSSIQKPKSNRQIGQELASRIGWTGGQWNALDSLWTRESGWNTSADTRRSGLDPPNAKVYAYGIPQSRPADKMASAGGDWRTNPVTQIIWGLSYIKQRYGSPIAAWAHEQRFGSYAKGGVVEETKAEQSLEDSSYNMIAHIASALFSKGILGAREKSHLIRGLGGTRDWAETFQYWKNNGLTMDEPSPFGGPGGFAMGGMVNPPTGTLGRAIPIIAHSGEWVVNPTQQEKLAKSLGKPIAWVREFLFGGRVSPATSSFSKTALMKKVKGYFGPQIQDWAGTAYADPLDNNPPGAIYSPAFIATPGGEYIQVPRNVIAQIEKQHGFWLPDWVKKASGWTHSTKEQIKSWKTSNIIQAYPGLDPSILTRVSSNILKSPLWNYDSGGMVGWDPNKSWHMPSYAAGGVVAPNVSVPGRGSIGAGVNQHFSIHTTSPNIDIEYIARVAKIHAIGGY